MVTTPGVRGRGLYGRAMPKSALEYVDVSRWKQKTLLLLIQTEFENALRRQEDVLDFHVSANGSQLLNHNRPYSLAVPMNYIILVKMIKALEKLSEQAFDYTKSTRRPPRV